MLIPTLSSRVISGIFRVEMVLARSAFQEFVTSRYLNPLQERLLCFKSFSHCLVVVLLSCLVES